MVHKTAGYLILLSLLLTASVVAQAQPQSKHPVQLKQIKKIVCLGDSITEQGENPGGYVWLVRAYLQKLYPEQAIEVKNAGISGHRSVDMLARFQRDVLDEKPDVVTISVGVNDVWHAFRDFGRGIDHPEGNLPAGIPLPAFRKNVEAMIQQAVKAKIQVIVLSTTVIKEDLNSPENKRAQTFNAALKQLAQKYGCSFVDYQKPFRALIGEYQKDTGDLTNLLTVDGVHMNRTGNRVMAHLLLTELGVTNEEKERVRDEVAQIK